MQDQFKSSGEAPGLPNTGAAEDVLRHLRRFYSAYGTEGEGPPDGFDADQLSADLLPSEQDVKVLQTAVDDQVLGRQFRVCQEIIEDLMTRLTTKELLRELSSLPKPENEAFEELTNGVLWFSLAASLDHRCGGLPVTPFDGQLDLPLLMKVRLSLQGSLVLRLYIALVYMREGRLSNLIATGAKSKLPCCGRVSRLLKCDYVRRIRNALGHGTFSSTIAGIAFRDDNGAIVASPGFLNQLSTCLMLIQLQALAATGC